MDQSKTWLLLLVAVLGCGEQDDGSESPLVNDQGELVIRLDGSVEDDGIFAGAAERDEFCALNPESKWCSDFAAAEQAWISAEYYGVNIPHSCYNGSGVSCSFPQSLNFKVHPDTSACLSNTVPLLAAQAIYDGFLSGVLAWNGVGGASVAVSTAGGAEFIALSCANLPGRDVGDTVYDGNPHVQLADLPVGPHGMNPNAAIQYDGASIHVDVQAIWDFLTSSSECNQPGITVEQLKAWAKRDGMHEMGHAAGFAHFSGPNLMFPTQACAVNGDTPTSVPQFAAALSVYNGQNSSATIVDLNLEDLGQQ
jgi:hypothetical protein